MAISPPVLMARAPGPTADPGSPVSLPSLPADLQPLVLALHRHGFRLRLEPPPVRGVYGLFESRSRTLWLAPIAFDLGIGRQTLLHEATHAAQSCPDGPLRLIGWNLPLASVVRQEIAGIITTRYPAGKRALEREAFALQGQAKAVTLLIEALSQRCRP
ncbi:MAG: hypothetical protein ACKOCM_10730 [Cyanobacteriota bacterium]